MSPEEACRFEAKRIAEYWFPRSRVQRQALENDVYLAMERAVRAGFSAGLERAPPITAAIRISPCREEEGEDQRQAV